MADATLALEQGFWWRIPSANRCVGFERPVVHEARDQPVAPTLVLNQMNAPTVVVGYQISFLHSK